MAKGLTVAAIFVLSLFLSSGLIAYFDVGFNSETNINTMNLPSSLPSYYGAQNFKSGQYNNSIVSITGIDNSWEFIPDEGMVHTSVSIWPYFNYFNIINLQPDSNNNYVNTYYINNEIKKPYGVVLRYTSFFDENDLFIDETGFHLREYTSIFGIVKRDRQFISYPDADKIERVKITTSYHEGGVNEDSLLTLDFNGNGYTFNDLNRRDYSISLIIRNVYYAGIFSYDEGTTLEAFESVNMITNPEYEAAKALDTLSLVSSMITSMLQLMTYTFPYNIIPLEWQVFLILPQQFMILIGIAVFIREG